MLGRPNILRSAIGLSCGRISEYALSFIRNVILARVLSKADFGLAAVFGMALTVLEVSGRMGFGQQVVQSKRGAAESFLNTAHAFQFLGAICSATLLASLSVPMAHLFKVPNASWALLTLALVPLCQGFNHLDVYRRQRTFDYGPAIAVDVVPQVVVTALVWPLAMWLGDYRVIVWLLLLKAAVSAAMSFLFSRTSYRWEWQSSDARVMVAFGWPLLLNGMIMFAAQQADQVLVGSIFSLDVLASYALAFTIVSIPYFVIGQVGGSLLLPLMASAQDNCTRLRHLYRVAAQFASVFGAICLIPLIIAGEQIITLLYGSKYHGCGAFMSLLGAAAVLRFLRFAPSIAAMAKGDTLNQLYTNVVRSVSLPLALVLAAFGARPAQIAVCAIIGEFVAIIISITLLKKRHQIPFVDGRNATLFTVSVAVSAVAVSVSGAANLNIPWVGLLVMGSLGAALSLAWILFPEARQLAAGLMSRGARPAGRRLIWD